LADAAGASRGGGLTDGLDEASPPSGVLARGRAFYPKWRVNQEKS